MKTLLILLTFIALTFSANTKHVFWYKCIEKNYSLSDSAGGKGPNIQGEIVRHDGKALSATIRGSAGNQDPIITLGNGLDNAQARCFVIWYKDLCDLKLTEGAVLKSAKFRGEFRDDWSSSSFASAGPLKPRVGVVNVQRHFDMLNVNEYTHPDNAIWMDPLNPLSGSMGYSESGQQFMAEEYQNFNAPASSNGTTFPLDGLFFEM
ncbi:MAG: hypothetical protein JNL74_13695, partial [Fibrobacteres bacterium]|nr:hypothetical protein [Fibrobacterota bacterium]